MTLVAVALCCGIILTWSHPPSDFTQDYSAAIALLRGDSIYGSAVTEIAREVINSPDSENFHPPLLSVIFIPFTVLDHKPAFLLWGGICIVLFLAALEMLFQSFAFPVKWRGIARAVGLLWYPCLVSLGTGQASILIAFLVVLSYCLLEKGKSFGAGAAIGLAVMVKMYPGLLVLSFLLRRDWRALAGLGSVLLACAVIILGIVGWSDASLYFLHVMGRDAKEWGDFLSNLSLTGFIAPLFAKARWVQPLIDYPPLAGIMVIAGSALILLFSLARLRRAPAAVGQDFALLSVAMLLLSPIAWSHGFVVLVLPLFWIFARAWESRSFKLAIWASVACLLISIPDIPLNRTTIAWFKPDDIPWYIFIVVKAPFFGLLLLWGLVTANGVSVCQKQRNCSNLPGK